MRNSRNMRNLFSFAILCTALGMLAIFPLLSSATPSTSIQIVNNTSRTIRYVYLSHVNADDWTGDQLGGNGISPGGSSTLSNVSCDQQQIKVIGEDQDGCFVYKVTDCGGASTWTITNDAPADCGQ
jgi:hypothetical protein